MAGDAIWMEVLPALGDMSGFSRDLKSQTAKAAQVAGSDSGKAWARALGTGSGGGSKALVDELTAAQKKSSKVVEAETQNITKARAAQKDAAAKTLLAEDALAKAREKYGQGSAQAEAAELRLSSARDRQEGATAKATAAESGLAAAQAEHKEIAGQLEAAEKDLADGMSDTTDRAADQAAAWGDLKGTVAGAGIAVAATFAAMAAGAKVLYDVGAVFDEMSDTIRVGTGATGESLDGLVDAAKKVGTQVPTEFDAAATTIADLNTRLGLTGDTAVLVASQVLEAGRIFGEDLDVSQVTAALSAFDIQTEDISGSLDLLFRVSQATGIGMNELSASVQKQAPALQGLGFTYAETASMVGLLDRTGMDADASLAAMSKGLVTLAKAGEEPAAAFQRVVGEIGDFTEAGNQAAALDLASKVFGARGATQFVGALDSGALALDALSDSGLASSDTILSAAQDTYSFAESWQMFKNDLLLQVEPAATAVFGVISDAMAWLRENGIPIVKDFAAQIWEKVGPALESMGSFLSGTVVPALQASGEWIVKNKDWLAPLAVGIGAAVVAWGAWTVATKGWTIATNLAKAAQLAFNVVQNANPIMLVVSAIAALVAGLTYFFTQTETGKEAWASFTGALTSAWEKVSAFLEPAWVWLQDAFTAVGQVFSSVWENLIRPAWDGLVAGFQNGWKILDAVVFRPLGAVIGFVGDTIAFVFNNLIRPAWDLLVTVFRVGWDILNFLVIKPLWGAFQLAGDIIAWVFTHLIRPAWDLLVGVFQAGWGLIDKWVISPFKAAWEAAGAVFALVKDNIIAPAWNGLVSILQTGWDLINKYVFDPIKTGVSLVGAAFDLVSEGIGTAWDKIKEYAAVPINFVLGTVYNDHIVKWWNGLASAVGLDSLQLDKASLVTFAQGSEDHRAQIAYPGAMRLWAEPETGGEAYIPLAASKRGRSTDILGTVAHGFGYQLTPFADGGIVGWAGDVWDGLKDAGAMAIEVIKDPVGAIKSGMKSLIEPLLSDAGGGNLVKLVLELPAKFAGGLGDWVKRQLGAQTSDQAAAVGAPPATAGMGHQAMTAIAAQIVPWARMTSGFRPGARTAGYGNLSYHAQGRAIDLAGGDMGKIWDVLNATYGNVAQELLYSPKGGQQILGVGKRRDTSGITRQMHYNHVHWAMADGGILSGAALDRAFWDTLTGGGIDVDEPIRRVLYDSGGEVPPGLTLLDNRTGKPETVLTADQRAEMSGGGGDTYHLELVNAGNPVTARTVATAAQAMRLQNPNRRNR